jgi:hypothetical protein
MQKIVATGEYNGYSMDFTTKTNKQVRQRIQQSDGMCNMPIICGQNG